MSHYIQNLIDQGEHQYLDFKYKITDARKIAKSLVAFANTGGGKLLVGVKDNGVIAGVSTDEEHYMIDAAASYYCIPSVTYHIRKWNISDKSVLEIDIPEGGKKPYYVKMKEGSGEAYIRIADENIKACKVQISAWKLKHKESGLYINQTEHGTKLLDYLKVHAHIPLNKACHLLFLDRENTESLLANLVYLEMIDIIYLEDEVLFKLRKKG